ncbi:hypothetical protein CBM2623_A20056 [Cupriavidus taiwanensis]|nr:hypothetical protein CBM2608_A20055 [Cupriavidus taiwanensis]SPA26960.1 hypothetical protein CBM2623_A20056 [Cupriavidus taiwanensis]
MPFGRLRTPGAQAPAAGHVAQALPKVGNSQ